MKIVIKIPKHVYEHAKEQSEDGYDEWAAMRAIANGTILPKGHGDLIDRSCICKAIYASEDNLTGSGMTYDEMDIYNDGIDSMWDKLQNAIPVIEAERRVRANDKSGSYKNDFADCI